MILDASYTLLVACIALLIGMFVVKFTPFLQKNHIPEAVVGGFIVAIVLLIIDKTSGYSFTFDASLQSLLMLTFFSSIGLSSDFSRLIKGGKAVSSINYCSNDPNRHSKYCRHEYGCHDE